ncbi:hypothetical protein GCM10023219_23620 [Stakelama sediminis]|uniref:YtxH domain-containing protein n=1 Tax=Stakelama sediminis TaxID=463200 RepID=A0A840YYT8_9SPHN|nr:hypothetical protein [Stakelama sediminis]MBB5718961.1 hypothetical protein [Stakelama sediminis]
MTDSKETGLKAKASDAASKTRESAETNPLAVLAGGIAVGMLAGLFIPRSEREKELVDPLGKRLAAGATAAAAAARDTGKQELNAVAPDRSDAKAKAGDILTVVLKAALDAGKSGAGIEKKA